MMTKCGCILVNAELVPKANQLKINTSHHPSEPVINSGIISRNTLQSERPTFAEALISTAVVEAAHESLANGNNWVNVKIETE